MSDKTVLHKESTLRVMRLVHKTVEKIDRSCALREVPRLWKDNGSKRKARMTKSVRKFSPRSRKILNLFNLAKENRQYLYLRYMIKDYIGKSRISEVIRVLRILLRGFPLRYLYLNCLDR